MLSVSDQLADAVIAHSGLGPPTKTHTLCGVYVPALYGLHAYDPPVKSSKLQIVAKCLHQLEDYLTASHIGFPDGHWWQFLIGLSEYFAACPISIGRFTEGPPDTLVDWKRLFAVDGKRFGIVARDMISTDRHWLEGVQGNLEKFIAEPQLERAAMVARVAHSASGVLPALAFPLVVDDQPLIAARNSFQLLTK